MYTTFLKLAAKETTEKMREDAHIVLVPFPAYGHVTPMLHLAQALRDFGFVPVVAVPDFIRGRFASPDDTTAFVSIPSGMKEDEPNDFSAIDRAMEEHMPAHLERLLLTGFNGGVKCVVVDLLASWAVGVAAKCGVPVAGFWPAMFATYRLISGIPELIGKGLISECGAPIHQQGFLCYSQAKLSTRDLPWLVSNPAAQKSRFAFWLRILDRVSSLPWILVNSLPTESGCYSINLPSSKQTQIFPVGPLLATIKKDKRSRNDDESCIRWLETQPPASVIYVSFGTWVGPIGSEKITELARGLEATNRPFLWALKEDELWRVGLPKGYLNRIAGRGKVVPWAPQEEVLKHQAVGCYVSHCGWNSTLEAIQHEKRLLCYPISGDQFVNCAYIVRVWGIGVRLDGLRRVAIVDSVEKIMVGQEGELVQKRVSELKERVMGPEATRRAADKLQSFIEAIRERKHSSETA